jgi:hypothetical protein
MSNEPINFIAPVANVDASILKLPLRNGFGFLPMQMQQAQSMLAFLDNTIPRSAGGKFFMDNPFLNMEEKMVYYVGNTITAQSEKENPESWLAHFDEIAQFENEKVQGYLVPTMRKLKIVAKGNVDMPFWFFLGGKDKRAQTFIGHRRGGPPSARDHFHLDDNEIESTLSFLDRVQIPLSLPYVELAFENYELSYQAPSNAMAFLTLMICLETLFNPGGSEVRYRLSRNVAVLLGETAEESEDLFKRVSGNYDMRSQMVHTGKTDSLLQEDIHKLRELCRVAIKRLVECNLEKNALLQSLNARGYGSPLKP